MNENKFIFHSTKTGEQSAFSISYVPSIFALIWAAVIVFNFLRNGNILALILFVVVFLVTVGFTWANIWRPWLELNKDKKEIQTKLPFCIWAISKADVGKLISIKKADLHQEISGAVSDCVGGLIGGGLGGLVLGGIVGLIFIDLKIGIFGGVLLGVLYGVGGALVQPGDYVIYTLKFEEKEDKKEKENHGDRDKSAEAEEVKTKEYKVYLENKEDVQPFETFLEGCLVACDRNDIAIQAV